MNAPSKPVPYAPPARWIHWIMAILVILVIPLGFAMMNVDSGPTQDRLFDLHRSVGFVILCLAVVRVVIRTLNPPPPPPEHMPKLMWTAANLVHYALYVLIFVMPVLGWLASNAFGSAVSIFGLFTLPNIVAKNDGLADLFGDWHARLGFLMTALVLLHASAGLWHGVIRQDGVLSRMWPGLSR